MGLLTGTNAVKYSQYTADQFNGNGSQTTFTLSRTPPTAASLIVTIDGIKQHASTYTIGTNQIVFSEAPPSGTMIECIQIGSQGVVYEPSDNSITAQKIVNNTITNDKLASTALDATNSGGTGAMKAPTGTTAQRPSGTIEMIRRNSTLDSLEYYSPTYGWQLVNSTSDQYYNFSGTIQFSTCGQTGPYGPILSDAISSYTSQPFASTWLNNTNLFYVIAGVQYWRVPKTGTYTIRCAGARSGPNSYGGFGRDLSTSMSLTTGEWLRILVGQRGTGNGGVYGGGGGASAVAVGRYSEWMPIIVSGGGAGTSNNSPQSTNTNRNGWAPGTRPRETRGGMGSWYSTSYSSQIANYWPGGGGGGWSEKGLDGGINLYLSNQNLGGLPLNSPSPLGGRYNVDSGGANGGFGGGGATGRDGGAAGGGGGWWGGNATYALLNSTSDDTTYLGGGSYCLNSYTDNGTNNGEGFVYITL